MRKALLFALVLSLVATLFSGFAPALADTVPAGTVNRFGWTVPEETLKFTWFSYDGADNEAKKNEALVLDLLKKEFNVEITRFYYDTDENEQLNFMLASGDYPDVISGIPQNELSKWVRQGRAVELGQYYDSICTNVKGRMGDEIVRYQDKDGKLFFLPTHYGALERPFNCVSLRYDWYQELGAPAFETPEEYYDILKKMIESHPTNANGEKVYALSFNEDLKIANLMGPWGITSDGPWGMVDIGGYRINDDNTLSHWLNTEEGLRACLFYNQVYRDGLLDPDAFINKFDDWKAKSGNERFAGLVGPWWMAWNGGHEVWKNQEGWVPEMRMTQYAIKDSAVELATLSPISSYNVGATIITDKAQDPESILKFIDFNSSPQGIHLAGYGAPNLEDSIWTIDENGEWAFPQKAIDDYLASRTDWDLLEGELGCSWLSLCVYIGYQEDGSTYDFIDNFLETEPWTMMYMENLKGTYFDGGPLIVSFEADNILTPVKQQLDDAIEAGFSKIVFSSTEDECIVNFNQLRDSMNAAGLTDIENYRSQQYQEKIAIW